MKPSTRNVMKAFRATSDEQRQAGKGWYREARQLAFELDPSDPRRAAAVIAVMSPLKSWSENVRLARAAYAGLPVRTLGDHVRKVVALLDGADPDTVVSGLKVRAFWHSIVDPDNSESVAVDRHALCAAAGSILTDKQRAPYATGRRYREVAHMYVNAARIATRETGVHWTPCELQAAVWVRQVELYQYARR